MSCQCHGRCLFFFRFHPVLVEHKRDHRGKAVSPGLCSVFLYCAFIGLRFRSWVLILILYSVQRPPYYLRKTATIAYSDRLRIPEARLPYLRLGVCKSTIVELGLRYTRPVCEDLAVRIDEPNLVL
ncbi:hypothetical protein BDW69DRAFT_48519 [Aspergillus filifer]